MSWLQQLVGKLKSVFGRKGAPGEAATEVGTPPRAEAADAKKEAPENTEGKPVAKEAEPSVAAPEDVAEKAAGAALAQTPATEPAAATETTAADPGTPAEPAKEEAAEPAPAAEDTSDTEGAAAEEPATDAPEAAVAEPAAEPEPVAEDAPAAEPPAPKREATNPAISTLDVEGITAELKAEGPYGPASAKPAADGSAPAADFTVKAKESSKLFHTEKSPYFTRTKADVWFRTEADAESAGFQAWDHKKRAVAKK